MENFNKKPLNMVYACPKYVGNDFKYWFEFG